MWNLSFLKICDHQGLIFSTPSIIKLGNRENNIILCLENNIILCLKNIQNTIYKNWLFSYLIRTQENRIV